MNSTGKTNLSKLFNERIYTVPNYQRGYSWTKSNVRDLLRDIENAINLKVPHYMGTVALHKQDEVEAIDDYTDWDKYHVVDGQQRFTTLIMIINELINRIDGEAVERFKEQYLKIKGKYIFNYEVDDVNNQFFRSRILGLEESTTDDTNLYSRNFLEAKKAISSYFDKYDSKFYAKFLKKVQGELFFNEFIVKDLTQVSIVFETINNRGLSLSTLELVKNRLLYLLGKSSQSNGKGGDRTQFEDMINNFNKDWGNLLKNLTLPHKILDDDEFLRYHWRMYNGYKREPSMKDQLLQETFTVDQLVTTDGYVSKIKSYADSLTTFSLHWKHINYPESHNAFDFIENEAYREEIVRQLIRLKRLNTATINPLLIIGAQIAHEDPKYYVELLRLCELFSFRVYEMNRRRSDVGLSTFSNAANDLYKALHTDNGNKLREAKKETISKLKSNISEYGNWQKFKDEIEELFRSEKKDGYYSWKGLIYVLYEYEEKLRGKEAVKIDYDKISKENSLEHVYPQTPKDDYWIERFGHLDKGQNEKYKHSLGNLLLLTKGKNSKLKNYSYDKKAKEYKMSNYSANEVAKNYSEWTPDDIDEREMELLNYMKKRWAFDEINKKSLDEKEKEMIEDEEET